MISTGKRQSSEPVSTEDTYSFFVDRAVLVISMARSKRGAFINCPPLESLATSLTMRPIYRVLIR